MKKRGRKPRVNLFQVETTETPLFQIEEGHIYTGGRSPANMHADELAEYMMKLPVDKTKSVFIPLSVAKDKVAASNLVLCAKRRAYAKIKGSFFAAKYLFSDNKLKKSYIGARIWRLA